MVPELDRLLGARSGTCKTSQTAHAQDKRKKAKQTRKSLCCAFSPETIPHFAENNQMPYAKCQDAAISPTHVEQEQSGCLYLMLHFGETTASAASCRSTPVKRIV